MINSALGIRRWLVAGGVVMPVVAMAISLVASIAEPDYSVVEDHISGLAAVPATTRWLMTIGFVVGGLGLLVVVNVLGSLRARRRTRIALGIAGVSVVLIGLLPRSCVPVECPDPAWHHRLHDVFSAPVYASLVVVPLLWSTDVDANASAWAGRLVSGATAVLGGLFATDLFPEVNGLIQRGFVLVPVLWLLVAVLRLAMGAGSTHA